MLYSFSMPRNEHLRPKTVPFSPRNRGIIRNPSDAPIPGRKEFPELAVALDHNPHGVNPNSSATVKTITSIDNYTGGIRRQTALVPILKEPLTPVFRSAVGGGRVGGGGTSKEARQRAKKNEKRQKARLKKKRGSSMMSS